MASKAGRKIGQPAGSPRHAGQRRYTYFHSRIISPTLSGFRLSPFQPLVRAEYISKIILKTGIQFPTSALLGIGPRPKPPEAYLLLVSVVGRLLHYNAKTGT